MRPPRPLRPPKLSHLLRGLADLLDSEPRREAFKARVQGATLQTALRVARDAGASPELLTAIERDLRAKFGG